ncbi:MAG: NAAT family transporter [Actinomycetota bacterium]|jgi:multiple antibiotic resistance protein|nr:NAAT family transporter [Actinomycetota bacterium]
MNLFAEAFVTILVVIDPVGNVPVFLALTQDESPASHHRAALQATLVATAVIYVFALFGQAILHGLGITLASLQVAGGLVLLLAALELLHPPSGSGLPSGRNVAFVPLGTPLLAGPGAVAAVMVYVQRAHGAFGEVTVLLALLAVMVVVFLALRFATVVGHIVGDNGIELLSRIVGLLLAAIAVQMVATGAMHWARFGV